MILLTQRLKLRPFSVTDAQSYFELTRDADIQKYIPCVCPRSVNATKETIEQYRRDAMFNKDYYLLLEDNTTHQMIGALFVMREFDERYQVCMFIGKNFRRRGYMVEAIEAFVSNISYGTRLDFVVDLDNNASLATMHKLAQTQNITEYECTGLYRGERCIFELIV